MKTTLILSLFLLIYLPANSQSERVYDLEDVNKTMTLFELNFNETKKPENLTLISHDSFISSGSFQKLKTLIHSEENRINLGYVNEYLIKEFIINKSTDKLFIEFEKGNNNFWKIKDAWVLSNKKRKEFPEKGLRPLAIEYNFIDLLTEINEGNIEAFAGLAPYGKLPVSFLKNTRIELSSNAELHIKDIIIHNKGRFSDVCYLKLKYFSQLANHKRGWLITDFGRMIEYKENDILVDHLLSNTSHYDLNKKSPYKFMVFSANDFEEKADDRKSGLIKALQKANIRNGEGTEFEIVGQIEAGKLYEYIEMGKKDILHLKNSSHEDNWYKIILNGQPGWVFGKYIELLK